MLYIIMETVVELFAIVAIVVLSGIAVLAVREWVRNGFSLLPPDDDGFGCEPKNVKEMK